MTDAQKAIDGQTHGLLVQVAKTRLGNAHNDDLATRLANYQTHYQMALDLNQPSEIRIEHPTQAVVSMWALADFLFPHRLDNCFPAYYCGVC